MSKRFLESDDVFLDYDWLGDARDIQNKLESVRNPYVGNKRKLLVCLADFLQDCELDKKVKGGKVLDLFSGSAFVSYYFKKMGAAVWSNDLLASSYMNALAFVESNNIEHISWDSIDIATDCPDNYISKNYAGTRFTKNEANRLDIIRTNLKKISGGNISSYINAMNDVRFQAESFSTPVVGIEDKKECNFANAVVGLIHHVMNHCYVGGRLNSGQVIAKLDHRLEHARNQGKEIDFTTVPKYCLAFCNGIQCQASRMDSIDLLKQLKDIVNFDIVYIDPPYGGEQSNYSVMYDFFEDFLGFGDSHPTKDSNRFTKNKTYSHNFDELLEKLPPNASWVFSYNDSSWADLSEIEARIGNFSRGEIRSKEIEYEYQYRSKEKSSGTEYLIVSYP